MSATTGRTWTHYERTQAEIYGLCSECGGPCTARITASGRPGDDDFSVMYGRQCLWCGFPADRDVTQ